MKECYHKIGDVCALYMIITSDSFCKECKRYEVVTNGKMTGEAFRNVIDKISNKKCY